jgi:hypothetical protein
MTITTIELEDRIEICADGRPVAHVMRYVIEGLRAHDGGSHQCRPARSLMEEIERREQPRTQGTPF